MQLKETQAANCTIHPCSFASRFISLLLTAQDS